jgi:hypothetical protein
MENIIFVGSIINVPNKPLSYSPIRSDYTRNERYEQTKNTIKSIRKKMSNTKIILVECSELTNDELNYFTSSVDYFINLYDYKDKDANILENVYSIYKGVGERIMILYAFKYLFENNIKYDNFYKLTGRYKLNDNFNQNIFNNKYSTVIGHKLLKTSTSFYKLSYEDSLLWFKFLNNNYEFFIKNEMEKCFYSFTKLLNSLIVLNVKHSELGITLYVSLKLASYD